MTCLYLSLVYLSLVFSMVVFEYTLCWYMKGRGLSLVYLLLICSLGQRTRSPFPIRIYRAIQLVGRPFTCIQVNSLRGYYGRDKVLPKVSPLEGENH